MPRWLGKVIEFASTSNTHAQRILLQSSEILLDLLERDASSKQESNILRIQGLILPQSPLDVCSPETRMASRNYCMDII